MKNKVIWKSVVDYEGLYEVSNYGKVKSLPKKWLTGTKRTTQRSHKGIILKPRTCNGYYAYTLCKNSKNRLHTAHRLVYEAFNGKTNLQVDHVKEGNKKNNKLDNLQTLTQRENLIKYHLYKRKKGSVTGASWEKEKQKWRSSISINGKTTFIGYFDTAKEAGLMYKKVLSMIYSLPKNINKPLSYYLKLKT